MIELEGAIRRALGNLGRVDGHDAGSAEMNIFIFADHPKLAFQAIKQLLGTRDFMPELKVAFREVGQDDFTVIHPPSLTHFAIM